MAKKVEKKEALSLESLEKRVAEIEGDQRRMLAGFEKQFGEGSFTSALREIVLKKQGR